MEMQLKSNSTFFLSAEITDVILQQINVFVWSQVEGWLFLSGNSKSSGFKHSSENSEDSLLKV